jgi:hypothetical protein
VYFNTRDKYTAASAGFYNDLLTGATITVSQPLKCVAIKNLKPKDGEELICNVFRPVEDDNYYYPAIVEVTNF